MVGITDGDCVVNHQIGVILRKSLGGRCGQKGEIIDIIHRDDGGYNTPTKPGIGGGQRSLQLKTKNIPRCTVQVGGWGKTQTGVTFSKGNKSIVCNQRRTVILIQGATGNGGNFKKPHLGPIGCITTHDQIHAGLGVFIGGGIGD